MASIYKHGSNWRCQVRIEGFPMQNIHYQSGSHKHVAARSSPRWPDNSAWVLPRGHLEKCWAGACACVLFPRVYLVVRVISARVHGGSAGERGAQ